MIAAAPFTQSMAGQKKKGAKKPPSTKAKQIKKKGA
jgi:hypothetical protein